MNRPLLACACACMALASCAGAKQAGPKEVTVTVPAAATAELAMFASCVQASANPCAVRAAASTAGKAADLGPCDKLPSPDQASACRTAAAAAVAAARADISVCLALKPHELAGCRNEAGVRIALASEKPETCVTPGFPEDDGFLMSCAATFVAGHGKSAGAAKVCGGIKDPDVRSACLTETNP